MASKQSVARSELLGVNATHLMHKGSMLASLRQQKDDGETDFLQQVSDGGKKLVHSLEKTEDESMKLHAVATLKGFREQLNQAKTTEEFDDMVRMASLALKATFDDNQGKKFWQEYGTGLNEANKKDMARLRKEKMPEFGKNSLKKMLADSQNVLAQVSGVSGEDILASGVKEIEETPFLNEAEKKIYRADFLATGILNFALQDVTEAEKLRQKYMPDDADLGERLVKTKELIEAKEKEAEVENARITALNQLQQKVLLWQAKERGEIDAATYYVLQGDDEESVENGGLTAAYQLMKNMHNGEELTTEEISFLMQNLITAYQQKEIDYDMAAAMQNRVINKVIQAGEKHEFADRMIDASADQILMPDVAEESEAGRIFMREKARLSFELYQAYDAEEGVLREEYATAGRKITPAMKRKIAREALETVKEAFGFETQKFGVFFEAMAEAVRENYHGANEVALWHKFYADAPYVADKKEYLTQLAQTMDKMEEKYADAISERREKEMFDENRFIKVILKNDIKENENIVLYPYLDTADKITVGPGLNIDKSSHQIEWWYKNPETGKLQLLDKKNKDDVSLIQKELKKLEPYKRGNKHPAQFFENKTNLRITQVYADKLYYNLAKEAVQDVRDLIKEHNLHNEKQIENFEKMPEPLQIVLTDMVYNLGKDGFNWEKKRNKDGKMHGYPKFWEALENHDLLNLVEQSKRYSNGKALRKRNEATKKLLEQIENL